MKAAGQKLRESLYMRFLQFRVIATLAEKGEGAAAKYIREADSLYLKHPDSMAKDAWFGYKIMCSRTANNINQVLTYLDSLEDYHKSIVLVILLIYFIRRNAWRMWGVLKRLVRYMLLTLK